MTAPQSTLFPHSVAPAKAAIQTHRAKPWLRVSSTLFFIAKGGSYRQRVPLAFRLSGTACAGKTNIWLD